MAVPLIESVTETLKSVPARLHGTSSVTVSRVICVDCFGVAGFESAGLVYLRFFFVLLSDFGPCTRAKCVWSPLSLENPKPHTLHLKVFIVLPFQFWFYSQQPHASKKRERSKREFCSWQKLARSLQISRCSSGLPIAARRSFMSNASSLKCFLVILFALSIYTHYTEYTQVVNTKIKKFRLFLLRGPTGPGGGGPKKRPRFSVALIWILARLCYFFSSFFSSFFGFGGHLQTAFKRKQDGQ